MKYAKALVAIVATIAAAIAAALTGDNSISASEWVNIAILGTGAFNVFTAPNVPGAKYTKFALAFLTAALTTLVSLIDGGVTTVEWIQIGLAALAAVGVYAIPNDPAPQVA